MILIFKWEFVKMSSYFLNMFEVFFLYRTNVENCFQNGIFINDSQRLDYNNSGETRAIAFFK